MSPRSAAVANFQRVAAGPASADQVQDAQDEISLLKAQLDGIARSGIDDARQQLGATSEHRPKHFAHRSPDWCRDAECRRVVDAGAEP